MAPFPDCYDTSFIAFVHSLGEKKHVFGSATPVSAPRAANRVAAPPNELCRTTRIETAEVWGAGFPSGASESEGTALSHGLIRRVDASRLDRIAGPLPRRIIKHQTPRSWRLVPMPDYLKTCETAVRRAGRVLLDRIGRVKVRVKGRADFVTDADVASQGVIRQTVLGAYPDHVLIGEEDAPGSTAPAPGSPYRWIADPLDGTTNFVHQVPFFSVSLALEHAGELVVAAVFDPCADECFTAAAGGGAFRNGSPIRTSGVTSLGDALVSAGFPVEVRPDSVDLKMFLAAVPVCQAIRRTGSAALNLAYVACGRFDAAWAFATKVWDVAAGALLIQEAGGMIVSSDGRSSPLKDGSYLAAATPQLHAELADLARRAGGPP